MTRQVACDTCGCVGTLHRVAQRVMHGDTPIWQAARCPVRRCSCHQPEWDVIHLRAVPGNDRGALTPADGPARHAREGLDSPYGPVMAGLVR